LNIKKTANLFKREIINQFMDKRTYSLSVGIILIILSIAFFIIPYYLNLDFLIPFFFALVSFILGIGFFFMGLNERK